MFRSSLLALVCCVAIGTANLSAQESAQSPTDVSLNADGQLVGNAFAKVDGKNQPVEAKITLTKEGVVVGSVVAKEDGSFAFPSVEPGMYKMYGSAANYVGGTAVAVKPAGTAAGGMNLGLNQFSTSCYGTSAAAPAASYSYGGSGMSYGSYGGGGGYASGFGGGGGGGRLLGRMSGRSLLGIGAIVGVVVAVSDNDSSPDN